jgi:DNA repair exonuclease SbcCD nuclease subunit
MDIAIVLSDIMGALSVLRRLDEADVPFLAVVGNHESKRDRQWLDLFERMGLATRLGSEPVSVGDVAFYGLDFVPRSQRENLDYEFDPHSAEYAALVSHGLFEPFDHGDWDARRILRESTVEFEAVLLGDDHEPQTEQVEEPHESWLTYCGSTERASASERDERGYNLVDFEDGVDVRRRGIETREFVFVDAELAEGEGSDVICERIGQYDVEDAVVIVTITGEGKQVMPAGIEEFAAERGALVARVNDQREFEEESELDVTFADPDDAVRERIGDLGLSGAARDIDETIRASKVADSNVADTVQEHVAELVDDGDDEVFDAAPASGEGESNQETESPADDGEEGGETAAGTDEDGEMTDRADEDSEMTAGTDEDSETAAGTDEDRDDATDEKTGDATDEKTGDADDGTDEDGNGGTDEDGDGDGQVTMEDYL